MRTIFVVVGPGDSRHTAATVWCQHGSMWNTQLCEPGYEVTSARSIYRHFAWLCHLHEVSGVNNLQRRRHSNVYINRFLKNKPNAWISELNYNTKQMQALKSRCFWVNLKSTVSAHRKKIFYSTVWHYSFTEILIEFLFFFCIWVCARLVQTLWTKVPSCWHFCNCNILPTHRLYAAALGWKTLLPLHKWHI